MARSFFQNFYEIANAPEAGKLATSQETKLRSKCMASLPLLLGGLEPEIGLACTIIAGIL